MSLRRNRMSAIITTPARKLPQPSRENNFEYSGLVAIAVVPVGSGTIPEKSPAKREARPVTSIQVPIMMPWYLLGASLPIMAYPMGEMSNSPIDWNTNLVNNQKNGERPDASAKEIPTGSA